MVWKEFNTGLKDSIPVLAGIAPYGIIIGGVIVQQGYTAFDGSLFSIGMAAGTAQLASLLQWEQPWYVLVLLVLLINFRFMFMTATLKPKLPKLSAIKSMFLAYFTVDGSWALSIQRSEITRLTFSYFIGVSLAIYLIFFLSIYFGGHSFQMVDDMEKYGLDFVSTAFFISIFAGIKNKKLHLKPIIIALIAAMIFYFFFSGGFYVMAGIIAGLVTTVLLFKLR